MRSEQVETEDLIADASELELKHFSEYADGRECTQTYTIANEMQLQQTGTYLRLRSMVYYKSICGSILLGTKRTLRFCFAGSRRVKFGKRTRSRGKTSSESASRRMNFLRRPLPRGKTCSGSLTRGRRSIVLKAQSEVFPS